MPQGSPEEDAAPTHRRICSSSCCLFPRSPENNACSHRFPSEQENLLFLQIVYLVVDLCLAVIRHNTAVNATVLRDFFVTISENNVTINIYCNRDRQYIDKSNTCDVSALSLFNGFGGRRGPAGLRGSLLSSSSNSWVKIFLEHL